MKIYTKTGDNGKTKLQDGKPIPKHHPIIQALAALDELCVHIGASKQPNEIQKNIMTAMSLISTTSEKKYHTSEGWDEYFSDETKKLESEIDQVNAMLPPTKNFVTYGTCPESAALDITRAITRRAETMLSQAAEHSNYAQYAIPYINRLSDYLYVKARYADFEHTIIQAVQKALGENAPTGNLTLSHAKKILEKIERKATEKNLPIAAAVCNAAGHPIAVHNMDNALLVSCEAAISKAYTAAAVKMPTAELSKLVQPGQQFYGLETMAKILPIGGGVPIYDSNNQLIGAIGVSGGTADEDHKLAMEGVLSCTLTY